MFDLVKDLSALISFSKLILNWASNGLKSEDRLLNLNFIGIVILKHEVHEIVR